MSNVSENGYQEPPVKDQITLILFALTIASACIFFGCFRIGASALAWQETSAQHDLKSGGWCGLVGACSGACMCVAFLGLVFILCLDTVVSFKPITLGSLYDGLGEWDCTGHDRRFTNCWFDGHTMLWYFSWVCLAVLSCLCTCCCCCVTYSHHIVSTNGWSMYRYDKPERDVYQASSDFEFGLLWGRACVQLEESGQTLTIEDLDDEGPAERSPVTDVAAGVAHGDTAKFFRRQLASARKQKGLTVRRLAISSADREKWMKDVTSQHVIEVDGEFLKPLDSFELTELRIRSAHMRIERRKRLDVTMRRCSIGGCGLLAVALAIGAIVAYCLWRNVMMDEAANGALGPDPSLNSQGDTTTVAEPSAIDILLMSSSYHFLSTDCNLTATLEQTINPMASFFFNETCLREVDAHSGGRTCASRKAHAFFNVFVSDWRFESLMGNIVALVSLVILMQLGGLPNPSDVQGKFFWGLWMVCQVGQTLIITLSLVLVVLGYHAGQARFSPCMLKMQLPWGPTGHSLLNIISLGGAAFHPLILTKLLTILLYMCACFHGIIAWEDTNSSEGFGFSMIAGEIFGRLYTRFFAFIMSTSMLVWLTSLSFIASMAYLPVTLAAALGWLVFEACLYLIHHTARRKFDSTREQAAFVKEQKVAKPGCGLSCSDRRGYSQRLLQFRVLSCEIRGVYFGCTACCVPELCLDPLLKVINKLTLGFVDEALWWLGDNERPRGSQLSTAFGFTLLRESFAWCRRRVQSSALSDVEHHVHQAITAKDCNHHISIRLGAISIRKTRRHHWQWRISPRWHVRLAAWPEAKLRPVEQECWYRSLDGVIKEVVKVDHHKEKVKGLANVVGAQEWLRRRLHDSQRLRVLSRQADAIFEVLEPALLEEPVGRPEEQEEALVNEQEVADGMTQTFDKLPDEVRLSLQDQNGLSEQQLKVFEEEIWTKRPRHGPCHLQKFEFDNPQEAKGALFAFLLFKIAIPLMILSPMLLYGTITAYYGLHLSNELQVGTVLIRLGGLWSALIMETFRSFTTLSFRMPPLFELFNFNLIFDWRSLVERLTQLLPLVESTLRYMADWLSELQIEIDPLYLLEGSQAMLSFNLLVAVLKPAIAYLNKVMAFFTRFISCLGINKGPYRFATIARMLNPSVEDMFIRSHVLMAPYHLFALTLRQYRDKQAEKADLVANNVKKERDKLRELLHQQKEGADQNLRAKARLQILVTKKIPEDKEAITKAEKEHAMKEGTHRRAKEDVKAAKREEHSAAVAEKEASDKMRQMNEAKSAATRALETAGSDLEEALAAEKTADSEVQKGIEAKQDAEKLTAESQRAHDDASRVLDEARKALQSAEKQADPGLLKAAGNWIMTNLPFANEEDKRKQEA